MTAAKSASKLLPSSSRRHGRLEDEVYRQMYRLEARRAGAEVDLALALLRAWQLTSSRQVSVDQQAWLKKICPICISMIEETLSSLRSANPSVQ